MSAERRPITYEDTEQIEAGLNRGDRLATTARSLGRTQQTVADEIRRNWTSEPKGRLVATTRNLCVHARDCDRRGAGCASRPRGSCACACARSWNGPSVSVNAFLANSTNEPAPIAPSKRRRFRQRKPAASG